MKKLIIITTITLATITATYAGFTKTNVNRQALEQETLQEEAVKAPIITSKEISEEKAPTAPVKQEKPLKQADNKLMANRVITTSSKEKVVTEKIEEKRIETKKPVVVISRKNKQVKSLNINTEKKKSNNECIERKNTGSAKAFCGNQELTTQQKKSLNRVIQGF